MKWFSLFFVIFLISGCSINNEESAKSPDFQENNSNHRDDHNENDDQDKEQQDEKGSEQQGETDESSTPVSSSDEVKSDSPAKTPPKNDIENPPKKDGDKAGEIVPSVTYSDKDGLIEFTFTVKNNADYLVNYYFDTAQRYDYQIRNNNGEVVKSFSKGKTFSKLGGSEPIKPGGSLIYKVNIEGLPKGSYTANFVLVANNNPLKASVKFTVE